jgi:hypothetical protein
MNTKKMPGFTAELALGRTATSYCGGYNGSLPRAAGHGLLRVAEDDGAVPIDRDRCYRDCVPECGLAYPDFPAYCVYACYLGCYLAT